MRARLKRAAIGVWPVIDPLLVFYNTIMPWIWYAYALHGCQWWFARAYATWGALAFAWYRYWDNQHAETRHMEGKAEGLEWAAGVMRPQQANKQYWRW